MRMLARAVALFAFVCLAAPIASAQTPPPPADLKKKNAQELRDLGNKLFEEKNYLGALAVYKEAYERFPNVKILLNIGITLNKLERFAEAANTFQRYVDDKDAEPAVKPELEKAIADIDKSVGVIELQVSPADTLVQINDGEWMLAPKLHRIAEGSVTLNGKKDGYRAETKTVSIKGGEKQTVTLGLSLLPRETDTKVIYVDNGVGAKAEGPRARLGAYAMEHLDIPHKGAATFIGVTFDVIDRLRLDGAAILGPNYGVFAGATLAILTGKFRPIASVGVPMFFSDGARFGMRGAGGLELQINRHLALVAEVGVEFMLNPEDDIKELVFIPAVGALGRL
jgi:hypothetical protein